MLLYHHGQLQIKLDWFGIKLGWMYMMYATELEGSTIVIRSVWPKSIKLTFSL